jgi:hypothetical protein
MKHPTPNVHTHEDTNNLMDSVLCFKSLTVNPDANRFKKSNPTKKVKYTKMKRLLKMVFASI